MGPVVNEYMPCSGRLRRGKRTKFTKKTVRITTTLFISASGGNGTADNLNTLY